MKQLKSTPLLLSILTITAFVVVFIFVKPIAQDSSYHHFIDTQNILGIQNFYNVFSNIGFVIIGFCGIIVFTKYHIKTAYSFVLCLGFILTGLGSAYYHYLPNNNTLVWDRLPMTIVFTTFFAQVYSWYINNKTAKQIWFISLVLGVFSVWYWHYTEVLGKGDLRLYALVQYLPMVLLIIIITLHYKKHKQITKNLAFIGIYYFIAKVLENKDQDLFNATNIIGGHPLKHIAAALACYFIVDAIVKTEKKDRKNL